MTQKELKEKIEELFKNKNISEIQIAVRDFVGYQLDKKYDIRKPVLLA